MTTPSPLFSIRLSPLQRWTTHLVLIVVAASGIFWSISHDLLQTGWMLTERRLLIAHGTAAALALVLIGALVPVHMRLAWRVRRNRASGVVSVSLMLVLGVTGLQLYYAGEDWREWTRWLHIAVGVFGVLAIPAHVWLGKRRDLVRPEFSTFTRFVTSRWK